MKDYLIIDRKKWRTGDFDHENKTGKGHTQLLNKEGYMCCLGFRCYQMGIPKKDLLEKGVPVDLSYKYNIPDLIIKDSDDCWINTSFTDIAIDINDDCDIDSVEREKRIKELFATINVIVEFKGKYEKRI
jgi:hypothetical protein